MKRFIFTQIIFIIFISCTSKYNYHPNQNIEKIITSFNNISKEKITDVNVEFEYQVFLTVNGIWLRISSNKENSYIDLSDEIYKSEYNSFKNYANIFIKVIYPEIDNNTLESIHKQLLTGNYNNYNKLKYKEIYLCLTSQKLKNGTTSFKFSLEVPNHLIKSIRFLILNI